MYAYLPFIDIDLNTLHTNDRSPSIQAQRLSDLPIYIPRVVKRSTPTQQPTLLWSSLLRQRPRQCSTLQLTQQSWGNYQELSRSLSIRISYAFIISIWVRYAPTIEAPPSKLEDQPVGALYILIVYAYVINIYGYLTLCILYYISLYISYAPTIEVPPDKLEDEPVRARVLYIHTF